MLTGAGFRFEMRTDVRNNLRLKNIMTMETRIWLITGDPAVGKTTVVSRILLQLRSEGLTVGGILTREIRVKGERQGFLIVDVSSEESANLATSGKRVGPKVGRYHINLESLSRISSKAFERARSYSDIVVCDEVGPMELYSPEFRKGVRNCILDSSKPFICVIHKRLVDPLLDELKGNQSSKLIEVTYENRESISGEVSSEVLKSLKTDKGTALS